MDEWDKVMVASSWRYDLLRVVSIFGVSAGGLKNYGWAYLAVGSRDGVKWRMISRKEGEKDK
jgi:hypothetical protein